MIADGKFNLHSDIALPNHWATWTGQQELFTNQPIWFHQPIGHSPLQPEQEET